MLLISAGPGSAMMLAAAGGIQSALFAVAGAAIVPLATVLAKHGEEKLWKRVWDNGDLDLALMSSPLLLVFAEQNIFPSAAFVFGSAFVLLSAAANIATKSIPKILTGAPVKETLSLTPESLGDVFYWCAIFAAFTAGMFF